MVTTLLHRPAPMLQNFVNCYALRTFSVTDFLPKPQHAQPEYYLSFLLKKEKLWKKVNAKGEIEDHRENALFSLFTSGSGCVYFKGDYEIFSVQFKSNGLFAIFNIPQKELIDDFFHAEDIIGNDHRELTERLENAAGIGEMAAFMNAYLLKKLLSRKNPRYSTAIAETAAMIMHNKGSASVDALAYYANMSLRNYERRFINEVGVPPKLYMRIIRFYNAIEYKIQHPAKSWTDICYQHGYFDQSHFIKECREFSSKTPEALFKIDPPPAQHFIKH